MHGHACCTPAAHIAVGLGVRMGHVGAHGWPSTCRWGCAGGALQVASVALLTMLRHATASHSRPPPPVDPPPSFCPAAHSPASQQPPPRSGARGAPMQTRRPSARPQTTWRCSSPHPTARRVVAPPHTTAQAGRSSCPSRNVLHAPPLRAGPAMPRPVPPTPAQRQGATGTTTSAPSPGPAHVGASTSTAPRPNLRLATHSTPPGLLLNVPRPVVTASLPPKPYVP